MTEIEDRLRAELADFAQRADSARIRPLRQPAIRARSRVPAWLAPAVAAAAVAALVTGVVYTHQIAGHRQPASGVRTAVSPFSLSTGTIAGLPRYYLTLDQPTSWQQSARAVVHSSATGAALATRRILLTGSGQPLVTGAADGRTFLIADGARIYLLRIGADGHAVQLSHAPVKAGPFDVTGIALSPDGSRVAIAQEHDVYAQVQVSSLATSATMTWRTRANGIVPSISWSAGGHQIGFLWESGLHSPPPRQQDGYRVLNVDDPGGNLLATSVDPASPNPGGDYPPAYLTPDGRAFITSSTKIVPGDQATVITKIISLSTQTGRVQQVLYTASAHGHPQTYGNAGTLAEQGCAVLSLDSTGQHPLVQCFLFGRFTFGTLASGHLKALPGIPNIYCTQECRTEWATAAW